MDIQYTKAYGIVDEKGTYIAGVYHNANAPKAEQWYYVLRNPKPERHFAIDLLECQIAVQRFLTARYDAEHS